MHCFTKSSDETNSRTSPSPWIRIHGHKCWISKTEYTNWWHSTKFRLTRALPIQPKFRSNQLKSKWNSRSKQKFPGTNKRPSEVLHFFRSNQLEWKVLYSISTKFPLPRCFIRALSLRPHVSSWIYQWEFKFGTNG